MKVTKMKKTNLVLALLMINLIGCGGSSVNIRTQGNPEDEILNEIEKEEIPTESVEVTIETGASVEVELEEVVIESEKGEEKVVVTKKKPTVEISLETKVVIETKLQLASFVITSPSDSSSGVIEDNTPTLQWSESSLQALSLTGEEITYDLEVGDDPDCSSPSQSYSDLNVSSQELNELEEGTHYVCLTAKGDQQQKDAGNSPYTLVVDPPIPAPGSFAIDPLEVVLTTTLLVSWSASESADVYDLVVSENLDCSNGSTYSGLTRTEQEITKPEGEYYICINAKNTEGTVAASNNGLGLTIDVELNLEDAPVPSSWLSEFSSTWIAWVDDWATEKERGLYWTLTYSGKEYNMYTFKDVIILESTTSNRLEFHPKDDTSAIGRAWLNEGSLYEEGMLVELESYL